MISLVNEKFLCEAFPDVNIYSLAEFTGDDFILTAANKSKVCVQGVSILDFGVAEFQKLFQVPSCPIIGYNIEHLVTNLRINWICQNLLLMLLVAFQQKNL